jgi:hypothetical protein
MSSLGRLVPSQLRKGVRDRLVRAVQEGVRDDVADLRDQVAALTDRAEEAQRGTAATAARAGELEALLRELLQQVVTGRQALHGHIEDQARNRRRNMNWEADRRAVASSLDFVESELSTANAHPGKLATLEAALAAVTVEGLYLEFGVATGGTLEIISRAVGDRVVYGFDSFEGLPERWRPGFDAGLFATPQLPRVPGAELVVGLFGDTLPGFLAEHPGPVAFAHIDADLYSSTVTVLDAIGPRLRSGSVLLFDEFFNYPGWQDHEYRAWQEFCARSGVGFEYLGFAEDDEQLFLRLA